MKFLMTSILLFSNFVYSADKKEEAKPLIMKSQIAKVQLIEDNKYKLELVKYAAAYRIDKKHYPCITKAMKEKKEATLTVKAKSLEIIDCKND